MANQYPVVFVHGLFGFGPGELGPIKYWGSALTVESAINQRFEASVGPIGSAHDRACELAAQIRGTQVDYGESHSAEAGHHQFGKDFTGLGFVPDWSEERPVHLVGHSHGAPTIRCLQHLLEEDFWGWGSNHNWVHSISAISGVLNGSTLVFFFGADEQTGLMQKLGLISPVLPMIQIYTAATGGIVKRDGVYDFDVGHWGFHREPNETLAHYLSRMADSRFLWERDNAAWSLTLQGAQADNAIWKTYSDTWYFSYVTSQTTPGLLGKHWPALGMNPAMAATATWIGNKEFVRPPISIDHFDSADWWENDGLVSTWSQACPRTAGEHAVGINFDDPASVSDLVPGEWHVHRLEDMDHLDITLSPAPHQIERQAEFYRCLLKGLNDLPRSSSSL